MGIIDFFKKYYVVVAFIGGLLLILNQTGFNLNVYSYYSTLNIEAKVMFVFVINTLLWLLSMIFIFSKIKKVDLTLKNSKKKVSKKKK